MAAAALALMTPLSSQDTTPTSTTQHQQINAQLKALLQQIVARDQAAFARFYDLTHRLVFTMVARIISDAGTAQEITQDVFLQVWDQADRYSAERGSPYAWLITLARSRAIDRLRKSQHLQHEAVSLEGVLRFVWHGQNPEQESILAEWRRRLRIALQSLPVEQRTAIEIAYFTGRSQTEVADALGVPLGTVKTRIRNGLLRLRESLLSMCEDPSGKDRA